MDTHGLEDVSSEVLTDLKEHSGPIIRNHHVALSRPKDYPSAPNNLDHESGREAARQWRRRRLLSNGSNVARKHTSSGGKVRPGQDQCSASPAPSPVDKPKPKKEPVAMRLRSLPQSFFQEPQSISTSSLAGSFYSVLPPLFSCENNNEEVLTVRPVTPPNEKSDPTPSKRSCRYQTASADTELLFSLFDHLEQKVDSRLIVKRGRPKKQPNEKRPPPPPRSKEDDPCVVDALSDRLFPKLSLTGKPPVGQQPIAVLSIVRLKDGERTVELPSLEVEQNYSAMLTELVTHM